MGGEWKLQKIGDLGKVITGKTPSTRRPEYFGGEYPFITIPDLDGRRDISTSARTLSQLGSDTMASCRLPAGAVITSCIATIGKSGITTRPSFTNQQINSVICGRDVDPKFLYYSFAQLGPALDAAGGGGSVYTNVSKSRFSAIEVLIPPLKEQQAIACILGALDDKIEMNRRMNRTLEGMARAIFKSWFVDFDPVYGNMKRRDDKGNKRKGARAQGRKEDLGVFAASRLGGFALKPDLAALFPDAFEDSELGEIPKGWRVGRVADVADVFSGKRPDVRYSEATEDARIPLWGGNGPMAFVPEPLIDYPILLTGRVGTLGSVFRITSPCWPSDNTLILRAKHEQAYEYLFLQLCRIDFSSLNRGSTQPLLTQTDLKAQLLPLPPSGLLERFHLIVDSLFLRFDSADIESHTLAALRDALLPKLISGEIRVKDAERVVGRAV